MASSQQGSKLCEVNIDPEADYATISFTKATKHMMESEMEVQRLENELQDVRKRLPSLTKEGKEVSVHVGMSSLLTNIIMPGGVEDEDIEIEG